MTIEEFDTALNNKFAFPGCYPTFLTMQDGDALCMDCAQELANEIRRDIADKFGYYLTPIAHEINWENDTLICCSCNNQIPSAYENPDAA